jgi:hypothetical protein
MRTNKEGGIFSWAQGRKIPKYGPGHSQSYDSVYFQVRGIHKVRGIYTYKFVRTEKYGVRVIDGKIRYYTGIRAG